MSRPVKAGAKQRAASQVVRKRNLDKQLHLFGRAIRPVVSVLASRHSRLADLAFSFPGLLAALACPRLGFKPGQAIAAVIAGRTLTDVAALACVPMWLRKLPPQAFAGSVPALPDGDLFRRQIGNHFPKPVEARLWLEHVARAHASSHEPFALWIARQPGHASQKFRWLRIELLGVWAWFSLQDAEGAGGLSRKRWSPAMELQVAREQADAWRSVAMAYIAAEANSGKKAWLTPGMFDGFEFIPILGHDELGEEAEVMNHCAASYVEDAAEGRRQLWSVRKAGRRVATLSLSAAGGDNLIHVNELRGRSNADVPKDVAFAARRWLNSHELNALLRKRPEVCERKRQAAAQKLWRPYWRQKRRFPWWLPANGELWD